MRKKKVWRYYCDFCKKAGCSAGAMKKHEKGCTNNPKRHCGVCDCNTDTERAMMAALLVGSLRPGEGEPDEWDGYPLLSDTSFKEMCETLENCPACILSVLRQKKIRPERHWDYKKAHDAYWAERNAEARESMGF